MADLSEKSALDVVPARPRAVQSLESLNFQAWQPYGPEPAIDLREYLRQLRERAWVVVVSVLVCLLGAVIYINSVTPLYEARAQLMIEPERPNIVAFADVIDDQGSKTDYYQTQYQVLRSRMLARRTMDVLRLWAHPEFTAQPSRAVAIMAWLSPGSREAVDSTPKTRSVAAESEAIGRFLKALTIEPIRNSRLLDVRFRSAEPKLAADVVNTLVRGYIDRELEFKVEASRQARAWLDERLARQREVVQSAEESLQQYRAANQALSVEGRPDIVAQRLSDLNAAATRARTERLEKEATYEQWQALAAADHDGELVVPPTTPGSSAFEAARAALLAAQANRATLARELGERHPDLIAAGTAVAQAGARVRSEAARVVETSRAELQVAQAKEARLAQALESQKRLAHTLDQKAIDYRMQQREAASSRQMLEGLLQRAQETAVAGELKTSNVRIVDLADVPLSTVYPRSLLLLGIAGFAGAGLGLALVLVLGHVDDRVRTGEEIRRWLDVTYLGNVPTVPRKLLRRSEVVTDEAGGDAFSEALRMVRTNLAFFCEQDRPRVILVTSTSRGEGKTLLATNVAVALAHARQRVLLVDGDMRRPRLHSIFDVERGPGLADLLTSSAKGDTVLRETRLANLTLLPAGTEPTQTADLLGFDPITQMLSTLDRQFDWVIVDSPPVDAATDACLLAHRVARVLFVVAGRKVSRRAARTAIDRLSAAGADFVGAVLTRMHQQPQDYLPY